LAQWPDAAPAEDLLRLARDSKDASHRALALRGAVRLAARAADPAERLKLLEQVRPLASTAAAKNLLLSGLPEVGDAAALEMALSFLDDQEVHAEAAVATFKTARALLRTDRDSVVEPMKKLAETSTDESVVEQAKALYAEALKQPSGDAARQRALQPNRERSDAYRKALAERAPAGYRLAGYLDCGPDSTDGKEGEPTLRLVDGQPHVWLGGGATDDVLRFVTIFFSGEQVPFEAAGLDPKRDYQLGFSWWDYDHNTRAQSVWASAGTPSRRVKLLDKTALPAGAEKPPAETTLPLPRELTAEGTVQIAFRNEGSPNVVVSELWLWESDAQSEVKAAVTTEKRPGTPVLLVTGVEYHNWRETMPVLVEQLGKDKRLVVEVVEDPNFLASPKIHDYPVMVMHWMNWQVPAPGQEARDNFRKYVDNGGGLVLVHFACGAFQDWPEFAGIAGRVWDPKLRGHDPHGTFRVEIAKADHPVTRGLASFDTTDELYTCLTGDKPVEVLATATSKVDQKVYPMAFIHECGKGRVFHCVLGHDANALKPDAVGELFRRGTAWAAKLEAVADAQ
jgi:type 1 glutamine amidotransferase